ncbi:mannose-6-phosphate isomerase, class I [Geobacillus stearothermophilus]|uniref:Mannose-6-phosphate isomerase n=3 Tax=Geobacillus TaxID=129337 RepID=A0A087LH47_GEOSE|nr:MULTISPECIES: mannose-6-phosphate isomerase, class I [Geobacillus]AKU26716.1 mannose-6-phosphate isomerase [Geobacillus sp. LC300]MED4877316.1 mannose-6-phosphate isomerase, class I [Anoxybacillus geothermalis]ATA61783.1 mannose-6-phosphate isomerase [Geobacillus stearothermophilus]AUI36907.1 mannose-6-phosphate isomerase, class I [[Bacillus] caldolyticus]KFL16950.1 mannose-6-phosphate isomerase [Geobacillus stearothermophilus]
MDFEPIFLTPVFQERIWGGTKLAERFGYDIPSSQTGECWAVSAHPHGQTVVARGPFAGMTLGQLWEERRDLFGHFPSDRFPLLTKILDANADLSVQVHPDDEYAKTHEGGELGKTECWYIIDCKPGAELIYGHYAETKEQLRAMMEAGEWERLLRKVPIRPGDFFYVPSGTIHALCEGTLVLETQQSSDTTYRVYDYDRVDSQGRRRELHLDKAIDVTTVPHRDIDIRPHVAEFPGATVTTFVEGDYFGVQKWDVRGAFESEQAKPFLIVSILEGEGELVRKGQTYLLRRGDHFILPHQFGRFTIRGSLQAIASWPRTGK